MSKQVMEVSYIIADAVKKLAENQPVAVEVAPEKVSVPASKKSTKKKKK